MTNTYAPLVLALIPLFLGLGVGFFLGLLQGREGLRRFHKEVIMSSSEQLAQMCTAFVPGDAAAFQAVVRTFLELPGVAQKDLASDCKVAVSTVSRWGRGVAVPGRHVQGFIVRKVKSRI